MSALVRNVGGKIAVASDGPDRGSTFTVTLPHRPDRPSPAPDRQPVPRLDDLATSSEREVVESSSR